MAVEREHAAPRGSKVSDTWPASFTPAVPVALDPGPIGPGLPDVPGFHGSGDGAVGIDDGQTAVAHHLKAGAPTTRPIRISGDRTAGAGATSGPSCGVQVASSAISAERPKPTHRR